MELILADIMRDWFAKTITIMLIYTGVIRNPGKHLTVVSDDRSIRLAMLAQDRLAPMGSNGVAYAFRRLSPSHPTGAALALRWLMPAHPTGGRLRFSTAAAVSPYRFGRLPLHHPQRIIRIPYYMGGCDDQAGGIDLRSISWAQGPGLHSVDWPVYAPKSATGRSCEGRFYDGPASIGAMRGVVFLMRDVGTFCSPYHIYALRMVKCAIWEDFGGGRACCLGPHDGPQSASPGDASAAASE